MARYGSAALDTSEWIETDPDHPCPICQGVEGCSTMRDAGFARCVEQPSQWPLDVGGWLHRIEFHIERTVSA